jgi:hypothetical protein
LASHGGRRKPNESAPARRADDPEAQRSAGSMFDTEKPRE